MPFILVAIVMLFATLTPAERSLRGQIAAHESWARTPNRSARTAKARKAADARFEDQVDPDRTLPPAERAKRVEHARKAHFARMAMKAAQARRRRADRPASIETKLADLDGGGDLNATR
jgi:hypothetical protein